MPAHELTDESKMWFGKYMGEKFIDIPGSYFHYLWTNGKSQEKNDPLHEYIKRNMGALQKECPDKIW